MWVLLLRPVFLCIGSVISSITTGSSEKHRFRLKSPHNKSSEKSSLLYFMTEIICCYTVAFPSTPSELSAFFPVMAAATKVRMLTSLPALVSQ